MNLRSCIRCTIKFVVALAGTAGALSAIAAVHTVTMKGIQFEPSSINAQVGDTLKFINDDGVNHVVFVPTKGFGTDLGTQKPGDAAELTLTRPGAFESECVLHPHMLLKVNVSK